MSVDKSALLAPRLGEGEHEIPGVGTVRIRGLSRAEVLELRQIGEVAAWDRRLCSLALVEPRLTEDEVGAWQASAGPREIEDLTGAVLRLSGMADGADKSGVQGV